MGTTDTGVRVSFVSAGILLMYAPYGNEAQNAETHKYYGDPGGRSELLDINLQYRID